MNIFDFSTNKPVTTIVIYLAVIVLGVFSLGKLAIDLIPDISYPVISIFSNYPGVTPEEIEENLTKIIERAAASSSNVKRITSTSREGQSMVVVEYEWGTDMGEAAVDLREKLDLITDFLPDEASKPMVIKFDPSQIPVMMLTVEGSRDMKSLRYLVDQEVKRSFEQIEGVASVAVFGGLERQIHVDLDRALLASYNVTMDQIINLMRAEHINISGGSVTEGDKTFSLRTLGKFQSLEDIKMVVISPGNGAPVYLEDVANIYDGYVEQDVDAKTGRSDAVVLVVQKQSGTNTVQIAKKIESKLKSLEASLPEDISIVKFFSTADFIKGSITDVWQTAWMGGLLAIIVIFLFLKNLPTTLIISVSIPLSVITTFIFMYLFKLTLNMMSLGGLALGIGMLVDNSIVVLENIFRYREYGVKSKEAAKLGSMEMINPIVASTLTTVAVFLPLVFFIKGLASELFRDLAFTVTFSLLASLIVAVTIVPMLSSRIKGIRVKGKIDSLLDMEKELSLRGRFANYVDKKYKAVLQWALSHRVLVLVIIFLFFASSFLLVRAIGVEFMPQSDESFIDIKIATPVGSSVNTTRRAVNKIYNFIESEVSEKKALFMQVGRSGEMEGVESPNDAEIWMTLVDINERTRSDREIVESIRTHTNGIPGVEARYSTSGGGPTGGGGNLTISIKGYDLRQGKVLAEKVKSIMDRIESVKDAKISREEGLPEYRIIVDKDRAASFGLTVAQVGQSIKRAYAGEEVGSIVLKGEEADIFLRYRKEDRLTHRDLELIYINTPMGVPIPLANLVKVEKGFGPVRIEREKQERVIYINAQVVGDMKGVIDTIKSGVRNITMPPGFSIIYGGSWENLQETIRDLVLVMLLAILLVYLIMAAQFESFVDPFIIMFTLPMTFIGVIWMHVITGTTFSVVSGIGIVMLAGIVVNNGIILVDYTNLLRKRGYELFEAASLAGRTRLRPILMTTLTTILGLVPMALNLGEGAEMRAPMARTVIGGLTVSTLFTLVLIPTLYTMFELRRVKRAERRKKEGAYD